MESCGEKFAREFPRDPGLRGFYGWRDTFYMYWFDQAKHKKPHIHAIFAGRQVVVSLDGHVLAGSIGKRGDKLVLDFVEERKDDLAKAWEFAIKGENLPWIKPIS